jgi:putative peptidoglycan lipid II flippase
VPLATTAFPGLTAAWQRGDRDAYAATTARTARVMVIVAAGTAAVMGAAAGPLARVVVHGAPGGVPPTVLARALAAFAPGLVGYAFVALLSRSLYAQNNARTPATAVAVGWLVAIGADIALVAALPTSWTVAAFGIGTSIGVSVSGAWLLVALWRSGGADALAGLARASGAGLTGGAAGAAVGALIARTASTTGVLSDLLLVAGVALGAAIVHAAVVGALDRATLRLLLNRRMLRRA